MAAAADVPAHAHTMTARRSWLRFAAVMLTLAATSGAGCSGESAWVATVDDAPITSDEFSALHVDLEDLSDDEAAGSALLLILHQAFTTSAIEHLGVAVDTNAAGVRFDERTASLQARGDLDEQLAQRNVTRRRVEIEAELDALRDDVAARLVRTEAPGFDLDAAYDAYLMDTAEICVQQIRVDDVSIVGSIIERLNGGEPFADVARQLSTDPFVDRETGRSGAGGDFGCSAPMALPRGLGEAALTAPLNEPVGPVASEIGAHVLVVYGRTVTPLEQVRGEVLEHAVPLQGDEMFLRWAVDVLQTIDVEVDDQLGRWGVLPETDPVPTVVAPDRYDAIVSD